MQIFDCENSCRLWSQKNWLQIWALLLVCILGKLFHLWALVLSSDLKKRQDNTDCLKILNKMLYINCGKCSINIIYFSVLLLKVKMIKRSYFWVLLLLFACYSFICCVNMLVSRQVITGTKSLRGKKIMGKNRTELSYYFFCKQIVVTMFQMQSPFIPYRLRNLEVYHGSSQFLASKEWILSSIFVK